MALRRARGSLLRLVRRRGLTLAVGVALVVPAVWLRWHSGTWWAGGTSLVLGATGVALIWTAIGGQKADWVD
jgi:hypothetical protein